MAPRSCQMSRKVAMDIAVVCEIRPFGSRDAVAVEQTRMQVDDRVLPVSADQPAADGIVQSNVALRQIELLQHRCVEQPLAHLLDVEHVETGGMGPEALQ